MNTDSNADAEREIDALLRELSVGEKLELIGGQRHWFVKANRRLALPALQTANGPAGLRPFVKTPEYPEGVFRAAKTTAYPAAIALAATWDPELVGRVAAGIGEECNERGVDWLLAPSLHIVRVPQGGRNFESYGEDPLLAGRMAAAFVRGVRSRGVGATLKHYLGNDVEYHRHSVDVRMDEASMRELYLRPFQIALRECEPEAVMYSYNFINGVRLCDNRFLLTEVLKNEFGFRGVAMADWGATRSSLDSFDAGADLDMPASRWFNAQLLPHIEGNAERLALLDDKVRRLLRFTLRRKEYLESEKTAPSYGSRARRRRDAERAAAASAVLLKNEGNLLPLSPEEVRSLAVIGPNADIARTGGGGSSYVCPERVRSPLEALREEYGGAARIRHAPGIRRHRDLFPIPREAWFVDRACRRPGLRAEFFNNTECAGRPSARKTVPQINHDWGDWSPAEGVYPSYFSVRFSGWLRADASGAKQVRCFAKEGARVWIDGEKRIDLTHPDEGRDDCLRWTRLKIGNSVRDFEADRAVRVVVEFFNEGGKAAVALGWEPHDPAPAETAVRAAAECDAAVVFAGTAWFDESEGMDLPSPRLPAGQDELIRRVVEANPRTVVVLNTGTPLLLDRWIDRAPAVLQAWFSGQEGATATAAILAGKTSPEGKLPFTLFRRGADNPAMVNYPAHAEDPEGGTTDDVDTVVESAADAHPRLDYAEGTDIGYRHCDRNGVAPLFAFGFGLAYTGFSVALKDRPPQNLPADGSLRFRVLVRNTGDRDGAEVVQVYVGPGEPAPGRPPKQLAAFRKVRLRAGRGKTVTFELRPRDFERWDPATETWRVTEGRHRVFVGTASDRIAESFAIDHHPAETPSVARPQTLSGA